MTAFKLLGLRDKKMHIFFLFFSFSLLDCYFLTWGRMVISWVFFNFGSNFPEKKYGAGLLVRLGVFEDLAEGGLIAKI